MMFKEPGQAEKVSIHVVGGWEAQFNASSFSH
jgi:hypothetical protein